MGAKDTSAKEPVTCKKHTNQNLQRKEMKLKVCQSNRANLMQVRIQDQIELAASIKIQPRKLFSGVDFAKNQIWC